MKLTLILLYVLGVFDKKCKEISAWPLNIDRIVS